MSALQEQFAQEAAKLIQKAAELGFTVTLGEAWRTPQQAAYNAAHGLGITHSLHIERLAIDLNFFLDGAYVADGSKLAAIGEWWESLSPIHKWGGAFKGTTAGDFGHFSLTPDGIRA